MRLLFLSSTRGNNNAEISGLLKLWLRNNPKIGYIPSSGDPSRKYFDEVDSWFKVFSTGSILSYLDIHNQKYTLGKITDYDGIYLSGGNTYHLINGLRKLGMDNILVKLVSETDIPIIGVSAGGIVLTLDIRSATAENDLSLANHNGLNIVKSGFYPHFKEENLDQLVEIRQFLDITTNAIREVFALPEFSGLVVENRKVSPLGPVFKMTSGAKKPEALSKL